MNQHPFVRFVRPTLEQLESRRLLAGTPDPFALSGKPAFKPITTDLADAKQGPMALAGQDLINIYLDYRRALKGNRPFTSPEPTVDVRGDRVGVTLRTTTKLSKFVREMRAIGMQVTAQNDTYNVLQGFLPINRLREVATRTDVRQIWAIQKPITRTEGASDNQADRAQFTDVARRETGLNGKGVKVGVLSDSVNNVEGGLQDSVASGDLPNNFVQIVEDGPGADEGRAILELIHDIVPGANLAYATANGGQQAFADNIEALQSVGASVIVDDIGYADEPFFQEGVIDNAMRKVVRKGAVYLESAGNDGNSGMQQTGIQYTTLNGRTLVDFDPGVGVDTRMRFNTSGGEFSFQWDEPYNGVTGSALHDLDVRFYRPNTNTIRGEGLDNNLATGRPVELNFTTGGSLEMEIEVAQRATGSTLPTTWRLMMLGGSDIFFVEHSVTRAGGYGHSNSNAGISVGAVPFFNAPPYNSTGFIATEPFTSTGGVTYLFDPNGNRLSKPVTTQKPDISGIDGVNTSFFGSDGDDNNPRDLNADTDRDPDTLPNFFGTSAAAPNVAAVVAMMKQANPSLTQSQVVQALKNTARPVNGQTPGTWDRSGGFGLVDASRAVPTLISDPAFSITNVSPDPRITTVDSLKIVFNQPVTGFTIDDLFLNRDGGGNLLTGLQTLTTNDNVTFTLNNLAFATTANGNYVLSLDAVTAGIRNNINRPLSTSGSESWTKIPVPAVPVEPANFQVEAQSSDSILLTWSDTNSEEDGYTVIRAEDAAMSINRKTIQLPANSTSYLDEGLRSAHTYYYRVRAKNLSGSGPFTSPRGATTKIAGDVVIDNASTRFRQFGNWTSSTDGSGFVGTDFLVNTGDDTADNVRYYPNIRGSYFVYARWPRDAANARSVQYDVFFGPEDQRQAVSVNQRTRGGSGWVLLGKWDFTNTASFDPFVRVRNAGPDGNVVADAMRFLPAAPVRTTSGGGSSTRSFGAAPPAPQGSPFGSQLFGGRDDERDEDSLELV